MSDIVVINASDIWKDARATMNANWAAQKVFFKGPSEPADKAAGQIWLDDDTPSATVWTAKQYDGTDWITLWQLDTTNNVIKLPSGTTFLGAFTFGADTSAGTFKLTNLGNGTSTADAVNKGQVDGRILVAPVSIPGISATANFPLCLGSSASFIISDVKLISDTATTASDGTNNYTFNVANVTAGNNLRSSAKSTNGADISANTTYALSLDQNLTIAANDVLRLVVVKNSAPTSLASAKIIAQVNYKVTT